MALNGFHKLVTGEETAMRLRVAAEEERLARLASTWKREQDAKRKTEEARLAAEQRKAAEAELL